MNILVIYTGGTIGSSPQNGYISTDNGQCSYLLSCYADYEAALGLTPVCWHTDNPYTILSENLTGKYIDALHQCIRWHIHTTPAYDGILITHGTDTLQYTAAALYSLCQDISIPIVLVSANYVLADEKSNGFANFAGAVSFIRHAPANGVFVSYQNNTAEGDMACVCIHPATGLLSHTLYDDCIHSLNPHACCRIQPTRINRHISYETVISLPAPDSIAHSADGNTNGMTKRHVPDHTDILTLTVMPGMYYPAVVSSLRAILLITYHSGTLPADDPAFIHFAKDAIKKEVPIYVLGADPSRTPYKSTEIYTSLHLIQLPVMSPADAYMQLALGLI